MTIALRALAAVLLFGAAMVARNEARLARAEAGAWQRLATLRYDTAPQEEAPRWGGLKAATGQAADAERRAVTVEYWLGRYEQLVERSGGHTDPEVLFVAANAAFRTSRRSRAVGPEAARQLDGVLQAYASVLKATPRHADAAFNYEFAAKLRDRLAQTRPAPPARDRHEPRAAGPVRTTDVPRGPTVHGTPGGPPADVETEQFEILTPLDLGDREAQPEQTAGGKIRRKG